MLRCRNNLMPNQISEYPIILLAHHQYLIEYIYRLLVLDRGQILLMKSKVAIGVLSSGFSRYYISYNLSFKNFSGWQQYGVFFLQKTVFEQQNIQIMYLEENFKIFLMHLRQLYLQYPKTAIILTIISSIILILRKQHYRFIVYPRKGGCRNQDNPFGKRHPSQNNVDCEDIQIQSDKDIKLRGWYMKSIESKNIIIQFHGNTGNLGGRIPCLKKLMERTSSNILIVSYRGFADSDGSYKPNETEIIKDASVILQKGIQLSKRDNLPLFVKARSLGGAAAIAILSTDRYKYSAKGLIVENTFTSIYDVAANFIPNFLYPIRFLLWLITLGSYNSVAKIKHIKVPILFVKGMKDKLVPPAQMRRLEEECRRYKRQYYSLEVQNGQHNNTWEVAGQRYFESVNKFILQCNQS